MQYFHYRLILKKQCSLYPPPPPPTSTPPKFQAMTTQRGKDQLNCEYFIHRKTYLSVSFPRQKADGRKSRVWTALFHVQGSLSHHLKLKLPLLIMMVPFRTNFTVENPRIFFDSWKFTPNCHVRNLHIDSLYTDRYLVLSFLFYHYY